MAISEKTLIISKGSREIAEMFDTISARYDLTNSVLSFGIHHRWRRALIGLLAEQQGLRVLDLCTGTGDLLPLLARRFGEVIGADFSFGMLSAGKRGRSQRGIQDFPLVQGSALALPFADQSFDIVTVAFGVRNFENLELGLGEIQRVLKPGASLLVLEFGQPRGVFGALFRVYSKFIIPVIGGLLTGNRAAYNYLPQSAAKFPSGKDFGAVLERCGFHFKKAKALSFGIAFAYQGVRPNLDSSQARSFAREE